MNILQKRWVKVTIKVTVITLSVIIALMGVLHLFQYTFTHINKPFSPKNEYDMVKITPDTDLETIFLQTGIGKNTAKKMIAEGRFDEILEAQKNFFADDEIECESLIDWFTREDRLKNIKYEFYDLQPGDILVTLSTHSLGWRHGHSGVIIDENTIVESISMGIKSSKENVYFWRDYSGVAVLRVKDKSYEERKKVADFTEKELVGKDYSIFSGYGSEKAPPLSDDLVLHCSYLSWYAWQYFGVDLDSDGGRLVTSHDILHSDKVEIVQLYGMDPREFLD